MWSEGMRKAKHRKNIPEVKTKTPAEVWVLWFWKPQKEDGFLRVTVGLDQASEASWLAVQGRWLQMCRRWSLGEAERLVTRQFPWLQSLVELLAQVVKWLRWRVYFKKRAFSDLELNQEGHSGLCWTTGQYQLLTPGEKSGIIRIEIGIGDRLNSKHYYGMVSTHLSQLLQGAQEMTLQCRESIHLL